MSKELFFQAIIKYLLGLIIVGLLLFIPAGSINYRNAWLFMIVLFIPMFFVGIILMIKNPKLLQNRLNAKESEKEQKMVICLSGIMFILGFVIAGLNYRYKWYILSNKVVIVGVIIFIISYAMYAEVLRENAYLTRIIKVQNNQQVIDTGFYSIVRHPMYSITILLFLTIPLILGSIISFIIFLTYPFIIAIRTVNEERILEKELNGYLEYEKKVRYRLIPYVW